MLEAVSVPSLTCMVPGRFFKVLGDSGHLPGSRFCDVCAASGENQKLMQVAVPGIFENQSKCSLEGPTTIKNKTLGCFGDVLGRARFWN